LLAGAIVVTDVAGDDELSAHHADQGPCGDFHHTPMTESCNIRRGKAGL
jgi:hypothetical protein